MRIALAGPGAFGEQHLETLRAIDDVAVAILVGDDPEQTRRVAARYGIPRTTARLAEALAMPEVEAVILCTPTPLHAEQAIACMAAGKPVLVEIPVATSLADAQAVLATQRETGLVCMVGHTRRFNAGHRYLHDRLAAGALTLQQLEVRTHFLRRSNRNARGEPRSWTDHLLWHHAAHTIDLFAWQAGPIVAAQAIQGPVSAELGIAMDMAIQLKSGSGAICALSLSFNNDGPLGTTFRYICDRGTWIARYDELLTGAGEPVDTGHAAGLEQQDRTFLAAVRDGRAPGSAIAKVIDTYRVIARLDDALAASALAPNYGLQAGGPA